MNIDITIPVPVQSLNKIKSSMYSNRFGYSNYKKKFEKYISVLLPKISRGKEKRHVLIIRHYAKGKRRLDDDNFRGGCKPIPDLLKKYGYIWDDSPDHFEAKYLQIKSADGKDHTQILIK